MYEQVFHRHSLSGYTNPHAIKNYTKYSSLPFSFHHSTSLHSQFTFILYEYLAIVQLISFIKTKEKIRCGKNTTALPFHKTNPIVIGTKNKFVKDLWSFLIPMNSKKGNERSKQKRIKSGRMEDIEREGKEKKLYVTIQVDT